MNFDGDSDVSSAGNSTPDDNIQPDDNIHTDVIDNLSLTLRLKLKRLREKERERCVQRAKIDKDLKEVVNRKLNFNSDHDDEASRRKFDYVKRRKIEEKQRKAIKFHRRKCAPLPKIFPSCLTPETSDSDNFVVPPNISAAMASNNNNNNNNNAAVDVNKNENASLKRNAVCMAKSGSSINNNNDDADDINIINGDRAAAATGDNKEEAATTSPVFKLVRNVHDNANITKRRASSPIIVSKNSVVGRDESNNNNNNARNNERNDDHLGDKAVWTRFKVTVEDDPTPLKVDHVPPSMDVETNVAYNRYNADYPNRRPTRDPRFSKMSSLPYRPRRDFDDETEFLKQHLLRFLRDCDIQHNRRVAAGVPPADYDQLNMMYDNSEAECGCEYNHDDIDDEQLAIECEELAVDVIDDKFKVARDDELCAEQLTVADGNESLEVVESKKNDNDGNNNDGTEQTVKTVQSYTFSSIEVYNAIVKAEQVFDSAKKQPKKNVGSGELLGRLRKLVNREKSNTRMWQYELEKAQTSKSINNLDDTPAVYVIQKVLKEFSHVLLLCFRMSNSQHKMDIDLTDNAGVSVTALSDAVLIVLNEDASPAINLPSLIRVCPPWTMIFSEHLAMVVLLNVFRFQIIPCDVDTQFPTKEAVNEKLQLIFNGDWNDEKIWLTRDMLRYQSFKFSDELTSNLKCCTAKNMELLMRSVTDASFAKALYPVNRMQIKLKFIDSGRFRSFLGSEYWCALGYDETGSIGCVVIKGKNDWYEHVRASPKGRLFIFNGVIPGCRVRFGGRSLFLDFLKFFKCNVADIAVKCSQKELHVFTLSEKDGFVVESFLRQ